MNGYLGVALYPPPHLRPLEDDSTRILRAMPNIETAGSNKSILLQTIETLVRYMYIETLGDRSINLVTLLKIYFFI